MEGGDDLLSETVLIEESVSAFDQQYECIHVSTNGLVTLGNNTVGYTPLNASEVEMNDTVLLEPLWTDFDTTNLTDASVYYTVYENLQPTTNITTKWRDCLDSDFQPSWALEVVWKHVSPFPASVYGNAVNTSFKAILFTDGDKTFAIYDYSGTPPPFDGARNSFIGFKGPNIDYQHPLSGTPNAVKIFDEIGNCGKKGVWVFPLFDPNNPPANDSVVCRKWRDGESMRTDHPILSCPCNYPQALLDTRFSMDATTSCADLISPTSEGHGMSCCYDYPGTGALLTGLRGPSQVYQYHPRVYPNLHQQNDVDPKNTCCKLDKTCTKFYHYRPSPMCTTYQPRTCAHTYGTPHITTFDRLDFTFSGKGEFVLLTSPTGLEVQGRMEHPWLNGAPTEINPNTTVFTAYSIHGDGPENITIMFNEKRNGIEVLSNGVSITTQLNGGNVYDLTQGAIRQEGGCVIVTYNSGTSAEFCHSKGTLQMTLCSDLDTLTNVTGLLGTPNKDPSDDLQSPDGNVVTNFTDPDLFFVLSEWVITPDSSRFWYPDGFSVDNFTQSDFLPIFPGQLPEQDVAQANETCNDNMFCLYDTIVISETRGNQTKDIYDQTVKDEELKDKYVPPPIATPVINVTINDLVTVQIDKPIPEMNITCQLLPTGAQCVDSGNMSVTVTWMPEDFNQTGFRFIGTDPDGTVSQALDFIINICDCNNHGTCDFDKLLYDQNPNSYFRKVKCTCDIGWTGTHCDLDFNGCEGAPCESRGTTCIDLPPTAHRANKFPYQCSACGDGFREGGFNNTKCYDINECFEDNGVCGIHNCVNEQGNHVCRCRENFVTDAQGQCIPEPAPLDKDVELELVLDGEYLQSENNSISLALEKIFGNITGLDFNSVDIPPEAIVFDPVTNTTKVNFNVTLNSPVTPKDEELIAGAMSQVVLENEPLVINQNPVPVLQDSPYIYVQAPNGTQVKIPLGTNSTTDNCDIFRAKGTCENNQPCVLDENGKATCKCAEGYAGEFCQYIAQFSDTSDDDLVNIGVPILSAAAAAIALTCLILAIRRSNRDKEGDTSQASDGMPIFGMPAITYLPNYLKAGSFTSPPPADNTDPLFEFPITYPYDQEEMEQYDQDDNNDGDPDNFSFFDPDNWFNDALSNEEEFNIPRPLVVSLSPVFPDL